MDWHLLITPLAGGIIGYITNDVAIRMLFRPYKPIFIGKKQLPLTPGLIPKEKERIAHSVGAAVGDQLFSQEVLSRALTSPEMRQKLQAAWEGAVGALMSETETPEMFLTRKLGREKVQSAQDRIIGEVCKKASGSLMDAHLGDMIAGAALEKVQAPLLSPLVERIKPQLGKKIEEMIQEKAPPLIESALTDMIMDYLNRPVSALAQDNEAIMVSARQFFFDQYERMVTSLLSRVLPAIDLARVAEERISSFEPRELEKIIHTLAKNELKAIVWLGALLGLVMGMLSALINLIG